MSEEIKEILYVLKHIVIGRASRLTCREADKLLDYITNLQQENEHKDKLIDIANAGIKVLQQEKEDYKSRCEKASDKLGNYKHYSTPTEEQNSENEDIVDSALNILQNGSDDNEQRRI